ncbi:P protein-like isoform X1 [Anopheles albimanus]|uniref:Citrate transporter-like domain-containing protein n=1 Tax=Anopheles albimanus TaxID=7167 RepID=A0A182F4R5_ANOAL|nr:P protein-like isoform X1 [Anopheles albimanus]XP_035779786.1 P protein-like isoform X1 [Anopheles albimanus]XP_035779787.1 P protein-like isoform X1 [Anopheles albimanus]
MDYLSNVFKRRRNTSSTTDSSSGVPSPASPSTVPVAQSSTSGATGPNPAATPQRKKKRKSARKRTISVVPISEVTEASLELWRTLPPKIRHDPSMVSFQQVELEHARLHGGSNEDSFPEIQGMEEDGGDEEDEEEEEEEDEEYENEFITINVTNEEGQNKEIGHVKEKKEIPKPHVHHLAGHYIGNITPPKHDEINDTGQTNLDEDHPFRKYSKIICLFITWLLIMAFMVVKDEKLVASKHLSITPDRTKSYILPHLPQSSRVKVTLEGTFLSEPYSNITENYLTVYLQMLTSTLDANLTEPYASSSVKNISEPWHIPIVHPYLFDSAPIVKEQRLLDIADSNYDSLQQATGALVRLMIKSNIQASMPIAVQYDQSPVNRDVGVIYAAFVLIFLYVLIIWEIVHRTFAAVIASTLAISILAALNDRPTMEDIVGWIDVETILLLFSMMILVAILAETGIFDYISVYIYKITNGKIWSLIHCLCLCTVLISSFLDNVTTVLLMAPITIRLCEVMDMNPVPILMAITVHANIGGTTTPVGDPPNIIITSNQYILKHGVTFLNFTAHMLVGVIIVVITTNIHLRIIYKNINHLRMHEPKELKELRRNIKVWERAAGKIPPYSKDANLVRETLMKKVKLLRHQYKKKMTKGTVPEDIYRSTLEELQREHPIKNRPLLIKSGVVCIFIVSLFFLESIPELRRLSSGWAALLGVVLLLIISDKNDMDAVLSRVEWPTLLFFAAMFTLMEAVERMGLIDWIGHATETIIQSVSEDLRLAVAIVIILWISALTSAFVDSIPVTAMMVKIVVALSEKAYLGLPLQPMVWALAFGPCLGGNGTLVGASANVICAGIAEQHGYRFSFMDYFKLGFPIMLVSVIVTTGYLIMAHVVFAWH